MNKKHLFTFNFNEKIFLTKLLLIPIVLFVAFLSIIPQYKNSYYYTLNNKVQRLKLVEEPKIVLVGNSNLAFGIDSEMLEKEIGMPVVNMGFHGGLGNVFNEEASKLNVKQGDYYILCHSNYEDSGKLDDAVMAWVTLENHWELWKIIKPNQIKIMLDAFPTYAKKCVRLWIKREGNQGSGMYASESFNKYGDGIYLREGNQFIKSRKEIKTLIPNISDRSTERINKLDLYFKQRGATLLIAGYPIIVDREPSKEVENEIILFQKTLQQKLDSKVISDYRDYCFDMEYFYDTKFHMTTEGVKLRTNQLIKDLKNYIKE